jgi:Family of unknown function (DUF5681)
MGDHETGYGKPPKHSRFKKGVSGNPKGRPRRGTRSLADVIDGVLSAPVAYREGGRTKRTTRRGASLEKYVRRALAGDVASAEALLKLRAHAQRHGDAGVERIVIDDWLPDRSGQTGEEKTRDAASKADVEPAAWLDGSAESKGGHP